MLVYASKIHISTFRTQYNNYGICIDLTHTANLMFLHIHYEGLIFSLRLWKGEFIQTSMKRNSNLFISIYAKNLQGSQMNHWQSF